MVPTYCKRRNALICFPRLPWYDETRTAENSYQAFRSRSRSLAAKFECKAVGVCKGARKEAQSAPEQADTSRFFSAVAYSSPDFCPGETYVTSTARRRGAGSVARRLGVDSLFRRSTLPAGSPRPCTASSRIRVISCESVRCSAAARRRSDSFK